MTRLQSKIPPKILEIWEAEAGRRILWLPLWLAAGIGLYFSLSAEPALGASLVALAGAFLVAIGFRRGRFKRWAQIVFLITLGIATATLRTSLVDAPVLKAPVKNVTVTGIAQEKSVTEKGFKLLIKVEGISDMPQEDAPHFVTVSLRELPVEPAIGSKVSLTATLYPPPRPAYPGGFDFQRYFYFKQVGGMGFGLPDTLKLLDVESEAAQTGIIEKLRYTLNQRITQTMPAPYGVIAAAFITGDTKGVPANLLETMRVSGIYHLLAVSGMNLVIVSGIIFFLFRVLFAAVPYVAIRLNTKKWAALGALIGTYFYLLIAGSPVSAERAYVMVFLILSAVILDRQVTPMRSLMLAATVILLLQPESLLNASFHLSFSATLGLIAWFELTQEEYKKRDGESRWHWKLRFYLEAVLLSSFVAWVSTMPFIIYHFQQVSTYSLPANMLCVPLISTVTMPALIAALLLMPLGLEAAPMKLVEWTVTWMVKIAEWFAQLPAAQKAMPPITDVGIVLIALGMLWCCIWLKPWRAFGLVLCALGLATMLSFKAPDILLSEEGRQAAFRQGENWVLAKGRVGGMQVEQWQEWLGASGFMPRKDAKGQCDKTGCFMKGSLPVAIVLERSTLPEDCRDASLVIALLNGVHCKDTTTISSDDLTQKGAAAIWLKEGGYQVRYAARPGYKRPWNRSAADDEDATEPE